MRARGWIGFAAVVVVVVVLVSAVAFGRGGDDDATSHYRVRAVFDNASFVIPGEDVKVAGVIAGRIEDVDLDARNKAVVVLDITDPAFQDFREDATCRIGLQSLIGEQYVDCSPTSCRPRRCARSRRGPARASTRWRSAARRAPSAPTCSPTSCACPSGSACA
jgi:phospholipid/cholesterol/gamma-HCH transport system substrate-binding protein